MDKFTVHREMQKMKFSYITPRPVHYKQNKENLNEIVKKNPKKEVFFFNESRFGTHSKLGHGWFKQGTKTQVRIKIAEKISIFIVLQILEMGKKLAYLFHT